MRNFQLFLIFSFSVFAAQAQEYVPFPTKNAVWKQYIEYFYEKPEPHGLYIAKQYKIERDTVIKGKVYHISLSERIANFDGNRTETLSKFTQTKIGGLREDSSKRIYFLDFKTGEDSVLYNFNQETGRLNSTLLNKDSKTRVVSIDSILLGEKYHKRYAVWDGYGSVSQPFTYTIEGIGNIAGLFTEITRQPEEITRLICFSINGETIYKINDSANCSLVTATIEHKKSEIKFNIFPNPTTGNFTIQTQSIFGLSEICVRDILGKIVLQEKLLSPNQTINISNQPKGLYFVEYYHFGQKTVQKVILK